MVEHRFGQISAHIEQNGSSVDENKDREFSRLLEQHERQVYAYILSLVPHRTDADEILQETYVRLFQKAEEFRGDFRAWAFAVARFQVMTYRKRKRRERLCFSDELLDKLVAYRASQLRRTEIRSDALARCLEKLGPSDRNLLQLIYHDELSVAEAAEHSRRRPSAVYQALTRVRNFLKDCVERTMQMMEQRS